MKSFCLDATMGLLWKFSFPHQKFTWERDFHLSWKLATKHVANYFPFLKTTPERCQISKFLLWLSFSRTSRERLQDPFRESLANTMSMTFKSLSDGDRIFSMGLASPLEWKMHKITVVNKTFAVETKWKLKTLRLPFRWLFLWSLWEKLCLVCIVAQR